MALTVSGWFARVCVLDSLTEVGSVGIGSSGTDLESCILMGRWSQEHVECESVKVGLNNE